MVSARRECAHPREHLDRGEEVRATGVRSRRSRVRCREQVGGASLFHRLLAPRVRRRPRAIVRGAVRPRQRIRLPEGTRVQLLRPKRRTRRHARCDGGKGWLGPETPSDRLHRRIPLRLEDPVRDVGAASDPILQTGERGRGVDVSLPAWRGLVARRRGNARARSIRRLRARRRSHGTRRVDGLRGPRGDAGHRRRSAARHANPPATGRNRRRRSSSLHRQGKLGRRRSSPPDGLRHVDGTLLRRRRVRIGGRPECTSLWWCNGAVRDREVDHRRRTRGRPRGGVSLLRGRGFRFRASPPARRGRGAPLGGRRRLRWCGGAAREREVDHRRRRTRGRLRGGVSLSRDRARVHDSAVRRRRSLL